MRVKTYRAHIQLDMGKDLRDRMLSQTREGREERIRLVRERLHYLCWRKRECGEVVAPHAYGKRTTRNDAPWDCAGPPSTFRPYGDLTADDVMDAVEALGMNEGDTRWTGNVLKSWGLVEPTDWFVPSRRKVRHAAPVRVWRWV